MITIPDKITQHERYTVWRYLQDREYQSYVAEEKGVFSDKDSIEAKQFGDFLREMVSGYCLDVGCGLLPEPEYMRNQPNIKFCGIDPFDVPVKRTFDFKVGFGESLPFRDKTFNAVVFASTIDHMIDPKQALHEAYRVLRKNGLLAVWYSERKLPVLKFGQVYNKHHQWGFTHGILSGYIMDAGFTRPVVNQKMESAGDERILWVFK